MPSQTWKYRCENDAEGDRLEELGDNGWELVGLTAIGNYGKIRYCFKRSS